MPGQQGYPEAYALFPSKKLYSWGKHKMDQMQINQREEHGDDNLQ